MKGTGASLARVGPCRAAAAVGAIVAGTVMAGPVVLAASTCPGYSVCPPLNYPAILQSAPDARAVRRANAADERAAVRAGLQAKGVLQQAIAVGDALAHDVNLSVRRNQACGTCHAANAGDAGGVSVINRSSGVFPGSLTERAGFREPLSFAYAYYAPVLSYRAGTNDFVGGNFWDMRATGLITGYPTSDQALVPFLSPFEMAMPDPGCVVYRASQAAYAGLFAELWGKQSFRITWPADVDPICSTPNSTNNANPISLALAPPDRAQVTATYRNVAFSITEYEASSGVSAFTSKFDLAQVKGSGIRLTVEEQQGLALSSGKANCIACHPATSTLTGIPALFTDFTAVNVGTPRNPDLPYLTENEKDSRGYVANPLGSAFIDNGVGAFLASTANTNAPWRAKAPQFMGTFQVPTLRNAAAAPRSGFVKAYAHNGYFTSLGDIVHFYNTRDVLPACPAGIQRVGETEGGQTVGSTCWPKPEQPANLNHQVGNLGLSAAEEAAVVAFLGTLTDGFDPR